MVHRFKSRDPFIVRILVFLFLSFTPAWAETPMTAAEFEAFVKDKTLAYAQQGRAFGVEQYFADRRVIWAFTDGLCQNGVWYAQGDDICFDYENEAPICWNFFAQGGGMRARVLGGDAADDLSVVGETDQHITCVPPGLGV